jgi:hypothetical protein
MSSRWESSLGSWLEHQGTWQVFPPVSVTPSVEVQDEADAPDPRVDLRHASLTVSRDKRTVVVTARLQQPTSPTTPNWWRGTSLPRPGITWGLNFDGSGAWQYAARLRGDPNLGAYGFVERGQATPSQVVSVASASFDGSEYRLQFPMSSFGGIPTRIRFTVAMHLYADEDGDDPLLGGDYAPEPAPGAFSDWFIVPVVAGG